ncbi:glycoside hydrolase family 43 protein, partial [Sphaerobolus stellatus SS14]
TGNFAGWGQAEGPSVAPRPNGGFRLWADGFNPGKYIYSDSPDLYKWTAAQTMPDGLA